MEKERRNLDPAGDPVDVSVVIPARNAGQFLALQLEALAGQESDEPFEVIIADNGSTDATVEIAQSFRDRFSRLEVVDAAAKPGSAHARNVGVAKSHGSRLVFADADDLVAPGYVAAMATALWQHQAVAAKIDWTRLNDWIRPSGLPDDQASGISGGMFGWLPFAFGGAMGVRRSTFDALGGFDDAVPRADDVEFCWRLGLAGIEVAFVPEALVHYRSRRGIRAIFRQGRANGREGPWLYRRYRQRGMPRRSARAATRFWLGALRAFARCRTTEDLVTCASLAGVRVGIIEGCIRHRVIYL